MPNSLGKFEALTRSLAAPPDRQLPTHAPSPDSAPSSVHPFDLRNIHPSLPEKVRKLFDDGHYPEATFLAFKSLEKRVQKHSGITKTGVPLMMEAFDTKTPKIQLTPLGTVSERDEQQGFRLVFAGAVQGIRNPRGHEDAVVDDPDICLDYLSFVSMLLRRLEQAGYRQN